MMSTSTSLRSTPLALHARAPAPDRFGSIGRWDDSHARAAKPSPRTGTPPAPYGLAAGRTDSRDLPLAKPAIAAAEATLTFNQAILPHLDAALNLARALSRNPDLAEDIVQDACLRALRYFSSFRGNNGRVWLLQIVRNSAYSLMQARRARDEVSLDDHSMDGEDGEPAMEIADPAAGPERTAMGQQEFGLLRARIATLPAALRQCLVLREFEEMSYRDIARITDVPLGTVMSRLWRARRMLLAALGAPDRPAVSGWHARCED